MNGRLIHRDYHRDRWCRRPAEAVRIMISVRLSVGGAILALLAAMACGGAMLAPETYRRVDLAARFAGPDMAHWLGRDELGRDTLSRLLGRARSTVSQTLVLSAVALCARFLPDFTPR